MGAFINLNLIEYIHGLKIFKRYQRQRKNYPTVETEEGLIKTQKMSCVPE
jgi:hypothetical protein